MTNVVQTLQRTALDNGDAIAIEADRDRTFSDLWRSTDKFAGGLRDRDVVAGDAVGICCTSPVEFLVAAYGTMRNGSVPVVIPPTYDRDEIERAAVESEASALVVDDRRLLSVVVGIPELRFAVTIDNEELLGVDFEAFLGDAGVNASGSRTGIDVFDRRDDQPAIVTYLDRPGDPVAIVRTHGALDAAASAGADAMTAGSVGTHLGCLPINRPSEFVFGATATIFHGGRYRAVTDWDPRTVAGQLLGDEVDRAYVTPTQYQALRETGLEPGHDGLGVLDPLDEAATAPADGSTRLCGSPETGITHVRTPADVQQRRLGTPLDGATVRVADGGDRGPLAVASDTAMSAYYERPSLAETRIEETDGTAWIRTDAPGVVRDGEIRLEA